jgi:hypothetical protein
MELDFMSLKNMLDDAERVRRIGMQEIFTAEAVIQKARARIRFMHENKLLSDIEEGAYQVWEDERTQEAVEKIKE